MKSDKEVVSICVATYKRPLLLEKLLKSIDKIVLPENLDAEIIIVDNDKDASAKMIVDKFKLNSKFDIKYFIEPVKNISLARNRSIKNAKGKYIAFIDDDETASEEWLINLYKCLKKFNADGVFGLVVPDFEEGINKKFKRRDLYFSPMSETGIVTRYLFAGNVLIYKEIISKAKAHFDPAHGLSGGEDANFFGKLKAQGAKFVNCREAISYEFISKERIKKKFFFNRSLRGGQTYTRNIINLKPENEIVKIILLLKSLIKIISGLLLFLPTLPFLYYNIKSVQLIGTGIGEIRGIIGIHKNIH